MNWKEQFGEEEFGESLEDAVQCHVESAKNDEDCDGTPEGIIKHLEGILEHEKKGVRVSELVLEHLRLKAA